MFEYKVIKVAVKDAEAELNRLAADGWRVVSTAIINGYSLTPGQTPMVITLERACSAM